MAEILGSDGAPMEGSKKKPSQIKLAERNGIIFLILGDVTVGLQPWDALMMAHNITGIVLKKLGEIKQ